MCLIQLLPVNDTCVRGDWRDSYPYSSLCVFALHPIYLCLPALPGAWAGETGLGLRGSGGSQGLPSRSRRLHAGYVRPSEPAGPGPAAAVSRPEPGRLPSARQLRQPRRTLPHTRAARCERSGGCGGDCSSAAGAGRPGRRLRSHPGVQTRHRTQPLRRAARADRGARPCGWAAHAACSWDGGPASARPFLSETPQTPRSAVDAGGPRFRKVCERQCRVAAAVRGVPLSSSFLRHI